jgi:23S rRNA pseudouridine2605 synthase
MTERLQKIIAKAGLASRRKAEVLIEEGRVTVNGRKAEIGQKADPDQDDIRVDGRPLPKQEKLRYFIVHKPRGVLSSAEHQEGLDLPIVVELVDVDERLYPVGRLDLNSEGLVLLTNDGELTNRITHPRYGHEKTYKVLVEGRISSEKIDRWQRGMTLPDGFRTSPCTVYTLGQEGRDTWLRVVIGEGHKRQIRSIAETLGHPVKRLIRTHIGPLPLGDLPPGKSRELTPDEAKMLKTLEPRGKSRKKRRKRR